LSSIISTAIYSKPSSLPPRKVQPRYELRMWRNDCLKTKQKHSSPVSWVLWPFYLRQCSLWAKIVSYLVGNRAIRRSMRGSTSHRTLFSFDNYHGYLPLTHQVFVAFHRETLFSILAITAYVSHCRHTCMSAAVPFITLAIKPSGLPSVPRQHLRAQHALCPHPSPDRMP
jgi:hypothetical protein